MIRKLLLGFGVVFTAAYGHAQQNKVNVLVAPAGLAFETAQIGADVVVTDNMSLGLRYSRSNANFDQFQARGSAIGIAGRFFLTDTAMNGGYYLSPMVSFPDYDLSAEIDGDSGSATINEPIYQVTVGHQWMWEHFNINLGIGASHISAPDSIQVARADGSTDNVEIPALMPAAELTMGWAF